MDNHNTQEGDLERLVSNKTSSSASLTSLARDKQGKVSRILKKVGKKGTLKKSDMRILEQEVTEEESSTTFPQPSYIKPLQQKLQARSALWSTDKVDLNFLSNGNARRNLNPMDDKISEMVTAISGEADAPIGNSLKIEHTMANDGEFPHSIPQSPTVPDLATIASPNSEPTAKKDWVSHTDQQEDISQNHASSGSNWGAEALFSLKRTHSGNRQWGTNNETLIKGTQHGFATGMKGPVGESKSNTADESRLGELERVARLCANGLQNLDHWRVWLDCYVKGQFNLSNTPSPPPVSGIFGSLPAIIPADEPIRSSKSDELGELWEHWAEQQVAELIRAAMHKFDTRYAALSIFNDKFELFKAENGYNMSRVKRSMSIGAHALYTQDCLVVLDASKDWRFFQNPLVTGKTNIRFFAAAPLLSPDGYAVGVLTIFSHQAKSKFTHIQRRELSGFGQLAMQDLSLQARKLGDPDLQTPNLTRSLNSEQNFNTRGSCPVRSFDAVEQDLVPPPLRFHKAGSLASDSSIFTPGHCRSRDFSNSSESSTSRSIGYAVIENGFTEDIQSFDEEIRPLSREEFAADAINFSSNTPRSYSSPDLTSYHQIPPNTPTGSFIMEDETKSPGFTIEEFAKMSDQDFYEETGIQCEACGDEKPEGDMASAPIKGFTPVITQHTLQQNIVSVHAISQEDRTNRSFEADTSSLLSEEKSVSRSKALASLLGRKTNKDEPKADAEHDDDYLTFLKDTFEPALAPEPPLAGRASVKDYIPDNLTDTLSIGKPLHSHDVTSIPQALVNVIHDSVPKTHTPSATTKSPPPSTSSVQSKANDLDLLSNTLDLNSSEPTDLRASRTSLEIANRDSIMSADSYTSTPLLGTPPESVRSSVYSLTGLSQTSEEVLSDPSQAIQSMGDRIGCELIYAVKVRPKRPGLSTEELLDGSNLEMTFLASFGMHTVQKLSAKLHLQAIRTRHCVVYDYRAPITDTHTFKKGFFLAIQIESGPREKRTSGIVIAGFQTPRVAELRSESEDVKTFSKAVEELKSSFLEAKANIPAQRFSTSSMSASMTSPPSSRLPTLPSKRANPSVTSQMRMTPRTQSEPLPRIGSTPHLLSCSNTESISSRLPLRSGGKGSSNLYGLVHGKYV
ncbi:hypothetical protein BGZ60DRAFT_429694 [Tricladium varicosporioides]|nr:hypothetical protein BGZ60DRAFT_429694 [Hymenoscyphus varicosporioides]